MADSLIFDETDDYRQFTQGDVDGSGAITMAAIWKRNSSSDSNCILSWPGSFRIFGTYSGLPSKMVYYINGGLTESVYTVNSTENWVLVAMTKATGSVVGRWHKYVWDTTTWTHETGSGSQASDAITAIYAGRSGGGSFNWMGANCLIAAIWDSQLSDGDVETLITGKGAWQTLAPEFGVRYDTAGTLTPFSGSSTQVASTGGTLDTGDVPSGWTDSTPEPPDIAPDYREFPKPKLRAAA